MLLIAAIVTGWSDLTREVRVPKVVERFGSEPAHSSIHTTSAMLAAAMISDSPDLPGFVREHRDEFNVHLAGLDRVIRDWRVNKNGFKTDREAYQSYSIMREKFVRANNDFYKVWQDAGGRDEAARLEFRRIMKSLEDQLTDEHDEIGIRFGNWKAVAVNSEGRGNWDEAVYYWRKDGFYGQWRIVSGSVARKLVSNSRLVPIIKSLPYEGPERWQNAGSSRAN